MLPVIVVGAGPAGLVAALSLLKSGVNVRIIEKDAAHHVGQRGAGVMPRSLELYNLLGVLPDILKHSAEALPMQSFQTPGGIKPTKTWRMSPIETAAPSTPWPNAVMISQSTTEQILREHLQKLGCHVELGTSLMAFSQNAEYVEATLSRIVDGHAVQETVHTRWLIGADGAHSTVRKSLGLNFLGDTRNEKFVIADAEVDGLDMFNISVFGGGPAGTVLIWPCERKESKVMTVYAGGPDVDNEKLASEPDAFCEFVKAKIGRDDIRIANISWITDFQPNIRMVDEFKKDRVFLVGDAAHVHSLMGGQGLNTSIQDSFNLAWKLALVEHHRALPALLDSYTEERLPIIAEVLNITTAIHHKTVNADAGDEAPWKRGDSLGQLGVNYRWSSFVVDQRAEARHAAKLPYGDLNKTNVHAGDRAPDAPDLLDVATQDTRSLFQIFNPTQHTVLVFSSVALPSLARLPGRFVQAFTIVGSGEGHVVQDHPVLRDVKGFAAEAYSVQGPTVVVVRPDGVVGAIGMDDDCLVKYFKGVGMI